MYARPIRRSAGVSKPSKGLSQDSASFLSKRFTAFCEAFHCPLDACKQNAGRYDSLELWCSGIKSSLSSLLLYSSSDQTLKLSHSSLLGKDLPGSPEPFSCNLRVLMDLADKLFTQRNLPTQRALQNTALTTKVQRLQHRHTSQWFPLLPFTLGVLTVTLAEQFLSRLPSCPNLKSPTR